MAQSVEALDKHIRACIIVFICLLVLTVVTVAVSYLHVPTAATVVIALTIATTKASMVAAYFMHLIDEKKLIYASLSMTTFFFVSMMVLIYATDSAPITYLMERVY